MRGAVQAGVRGSAVRRVVAAGNNFFLLINKIHFHYRVKDFETAYGNVTRAVCATAVAVRVRNQLRERPMSGSR